VIRLENSNTVKNLRDQLQLMLTSGNDDGGFPILRKVDEDEENYRMVGYIGANELEHALSMCSLCSQNEKGSGRNG
jgi:chloride channel 3/4/5